MKNQYLFVIILFVSTVGALVGCSTVYNPATGKEHLSVITTSKEIKLGKSISDKIEEHYGVLNDIESQSRVEKIGKKIASLSSRQEITYHFDILDEDEPNAVSLPGGYIYINKGLFEKLETDDQVACVLAHEMAHIEARHSINRLQKALGYKALQIIVIQNAESSRTKTNTTRAINELFLAYSREDEFEADKLSLRYLSEAGYNPYATLEVLEVLKQIKKEKPIERMHAKTHPYVYDRTREIKILLSGEINFTDYINKTFGD